MKNRLPTELPFKMTLSIYIHRLRVVLLCGVTPILFLLVSYLIALMENFIFFSISTVLAVFLLWKINNYLCASIYQANIFTDIEKKSNSLIKSFKVSREVSVFATLILLVVSVFFFQEGASSYGNRTGFNMPKLNHSEYSYFAKNVKMIPATYLAWAKANSKSEHIYGTSNYNDNSDAFRHCFATALLVKEVGYVEAIKITTNHEKYEENDRLDMIMDLYNNSIGGQIGKQFKEESDDDIAELIKILAEKGILIRSKNEAQQWLKPQ